jgi:acyl-CoA reductase-like NAD-dependent aldehyde dehydrogenase
MTGAPRHVRLGASWEDAYARCHQSAPEAFERDQVRNLWDGEWHLAGNPTEATSPVDGSPIAGPPMLQLEQALEAVAAAAAEHRQWVKVDLDERRARVARCVDQLQAHRELLALLLVWEIGKPWRQALTSVDRTITGVRWYLEEIEPMLAGRQPLAGPVSNIASWNYPLSVLVHAMLVQLLAGDAVIAKTPTDGGVCALTLSAAFMRRCELPVTLLSGSGSRLSPALVLNDDIGCLAFVGGRDVGGQIASQLVQTDKRHMLEQEGLNAWGIWEFSDWDTLAVHLKKGFEYGKQRCTAYPRYVVQRTLFDRFLAMYLEVARSLSFGHPLAVVDPRTSRPTWTSGPSSTPPR